MSTTDSTGRSTGSALTTLVPVPESGRTFVAERRVRLSDADVSGRLRLDAIARYLQDVATDDVAETGWGAGEHFWLVRRSLVQVVASPQFGELLEMTTWSSGTGVAAATRRTSLVGEHGGRVETETVWVHLGSEMRPARFDESFFALYGPSTQGRRITTRLELPDPPDDAKRRPWALRAADLDMLGHVNNAAYWGAVEEVLSLHEWSPNGALEAVLEYRAPIDLTDEIELRHAQDGDGIRLALAAADSVRAVGLVRTGLRAPAIAG